MTVRDDFVVFLYLWHFAWLLCLFYQSLAHYIMFECRCTGYIICVSRGFPRLLTWLMVNLALVEYVQCESCIQWKISLFTYLYMYDTFTTLTIHRGCIYDFNNSVCHNHFENLRVMSQ